MKPRVHVFKTGYINDKKNLNAKNVFVHPVVSILAIQRVYVAAATAATANLNSHATKNRSLNSKTERKQKF